MIHNQRLIRGINYCFPLSMVCWWLIDFYYDGRMAKRGVLIVVIKHNISWTHIAFADKSSPLRVISQQQEILVVFEIIIVIRQVFKSYFSEIYPVTPTVTLKTNRMTNKSYLLRVFFLPNTSASSTIGPSKAPVGLPPQGT